MPLQQWTLHGDLESLPWVYLPGNMENHFPWRSGHLLIQVWGASWESFLHHGTHRHATLLRQHCSSCLVPMLVAPKTPLFHFTFWDTEHTLFNKLKYGGTKYLKFRWINLLCSLWVNSLKLWALILLDWILGTIDILPLSLGHTRTWPPSSVGRASNLGATIITTDVVSVRGFRVP